MMQPFHVNNILLFTATIISLIPRGIDAFICHARCNNINTRHDTSLCSLNEHRGRFTSDLDTSLEWLAKERQIHDLDNTFPIQWFDIDDDKTGYHVDVEDASNLLRVPLYPLNAVYTPHSGENHTLVNTEPRNVKMTADIVAGKWDRSLFCVTLRARDTNRLASVGTLCRLIDTEDRSISGARTWPGDVLPTLNRVVVTCEAVGIVDIVNVENGDSNNKYSTDEYKVARVRLRSFANDTTKGKTEEMDNLTQQIVNDYKKVRETYINSQSLASNELPKFARKAVHALPTFETLDDELDFWKLVDTWQVLCNTIRQSKLTQLQGLINELTVQVAMQTKKGPLELPVKRKSLPEDVQKQLDEMEQSAACDYAELGMEPILDFQELISMECSVDRFRKLGAMIKRERSRLEAKESLIKAFLKELD